MTTDWSSEKDWGLTYRLTCLLQSTISLPVGLGACHVGLPLRTVDLSERLSFFQRCTSGVRQTYP
jgi:hypothetical protein